MPYSIVSDSIVTTAGTVFVVSSSAGNIEPGTLEGLYAQDTRFLSEFRLSIDDKPLEHLRSGSIDHALSSFYGTTPNGGMERHGSFSVVRDRYVSHGMHDEIFVFNHSTEEREITLKLSLDADFADLFEVRSGGIIKVGEHTFDILPDGSVRMIYQRGPFVRETRVIFSSPPEFSGSSAYFKPTIFPGEQWKFCISVLPVFDEEPEPMPCQEEGLGPPTGMAPVSVPESLQRQQITPGDPFSTAPDVDTIHTAIDQAYASAIDDLRSLKIEQKSGQVVLAAGLPWFMAIFGRDSIISAIQTKIVGPDLLFGTLDTLAKYQASDVDEFREAQPGKIPHEIREGELSHFQIVPHSRYYGSVDSTPLFLILLAETYKWTGDLDRISKLLPSAEMALRWIDEFGDVDGDRFVEYDTGSARALRNRCWKDSEDSISFADGRLAEGSIAAVEVQGYVYAAKQGLAEVYAAIGDTAKSIQLTEEADELKRRFNEMFWMPEHGFYALALDGEKNQVDSISSNPGHCLWSGIVEESKAKTVVDRLMAPDMFNGWGIRTLSSQMARYHPVSYHNGSVWPHDSSLIAGGFSRYGYHEQAVRLLASLFDAASTMPEYKMPELFAGYPRRASSFPVPYPAANSPQAWAAGAMVYAVELLLRLHPKGDRLVSDVPAINRPLSLSGLNYRGTIVGF